MSTTVKATTSEEVSGNKFMALIRREIGQVFAIAGLVIIFAFFSFMKPVFYSWANVSNGILMSTTVTGLLAVGITFVIITGGIDLSIGTGTTLCAILVAHYVVGWHLPLWSGFVIGMSFGALIGALNGAMIAFLKLPPFIATLATMKAAQGLALIISHLTPIRFDTVKGWESIAQGNLIGSIPNGVLILFGAAIVAWFILNRTVIGRYTFAIGSNGEATKLSGVKVERWLILIYALCGLFVGLAAVVLTARLGAAEPDLGLGYELEAIAAVIIGGTSLLGGKGTISGTIIGALIMAVLTNGLRILKVQQEWQYVVVGIVIVIAVFGDNVRRRRAGEIS